MNDQRQAHYQQTKFQKSDCPFKKDLVHPPSDKMLIFDLTIVFVSECLRTFTIRIRTIQQRVDL